MEIDGERLRVLREQRVLSLSMLEELSGVARETILALEQGRRPARQSTIHKLAAVLGIEPCELLQTPESRRDREE